MFKRLFKHVAPSGQDLNEYTALVDTFIHTEKTLHELPELSPDEKVSLEQEIAISHLYHSSKIEGTNLNTERLNKAINA